MLGWLLWAPLALLRWLLSPVPLLVIGVSLGLLYYWYTKNYGFWEARGVRGPPASFPYGNKFGVPFAELPALQEDWLYHEHGGKKFCGFYEMRNPALFVGDLDLIRAITVKDFDSFSDLREIQGTAVFKEVLSSLSGQKWKDTRAVMTPAFSASKLKAMHQLTLEAADSLVRTALSETEKKGEVEMKHACGCFTMDNIALCGFGVKCDSFNDPNCKFAEYAAKIFKLSPYGIFLFMMAQFVPEAIVNLLPDPQADVNDFFAGITHQTIAQREKSGDQGRDVMSLLLNTKDKDGQRVLSKESIVAQSVLFFIAGYETTAALMTNALYSLATAPECQRLAQEEIDEVLERHGGELTYDAVHEMTYLDRVMSETLRLYPPATRMERHCTKPYTLPGTSVQIPPRTLVVMPVFNIHRDPDHWPEPLRFDPDRFLPEAKEKRHPCAYVPFGNGPRNCIAMRFALFEAKTALAALLRKADVLPTKQTPPPPMPLDKKSPILLPEGSKMPLRIVRRAKA